MATKFEKEGRRLTNKPDTGDLLEALEESLMLNRAGSLVQRLGELQPNHFVMEWDGSKCPRGAKVGGVDIEWAQHGMIYGTNEHNIRVTLGTYQRKEEFSGKKKSHHRIIISTDSAMAVNPDGSQCQRASMEEALPREDFLNILEYKLKNQEGDNNAFQTLIRLVNTQKDRLAFRILFDFAADGPETSNDRTPQRMTGLQQEAAQFVISKQGSEFFENWHPEHLRNLKARLAKTKKTTGPTGPSCG